MNLNHQSFITEYLRHRSPFTAYCLAYNLKDCSNYESIMSAANRLMNNEEVGGTIRSILDNIRHEVEHEVRAEMKQEVLTIQRKRELLASIATGEMVAIQLYKGKDCNVCTQMVRPTINQMLRAIDLDNKMVGLYQIHSRQLTVQKVPKPQQFRTTAEPSMRPMKIITNEINDTNKPQSWKSYNPEKIPVPQNCGADSDKKVPKSQQTTTKLVSPLQEGDRGTFAQDTPEKNTPIGNNGTALNETNENYHERINPQQSVAMDNEIESLSISTQIGNPVPQSAGKT